MYREKVANAHLLASGTRANIDSIGRSQLHRLFAHAGLGSAGAYVKSLQFRFAMKLLRVSRLSIAEIAYRVGFASSTQFSAFIRQRSGKPPIAHRGKA